MARAVHDLLQWARSHNTTIHDAIQVYHDPVTGLSFRAAEDIPPGVTLVNCSYNTSLSYLNAVGTTSHFTAHGSEPFPPAFLERVGLESPHIIGYFFLIQQHLMGEKSFWYKYIRLLPQPDQLEDFGLPMFWSEEDRNFLAGTNAEPPLKKKLQLWHREWSDSIAILQPHLSDWFKYTDKLYYWAASIFGTRSFRASLTVPLTNPVENTTSSQQQWAMNRDHVLKDNFSILLPVLDIGNHDGVNRVEWSKRPVSGHFAVTLSQRVEKGAQIFNYYGSKSNSELLVGYGFILPALEQDIVNFKMTPTPEAAKLRLAQACHKEPVEPEEKFMFSVRRQTTAEEINDGIIGLQIFSHGLFETLICMVANGRERRFLEQNPEYCVESSPNMFAGPLYKASLLALQILKLKLDTDVNNIEARNATLPSPQTRYQQMALEYRQRQTIILEEAMKATRQHLQLALGFRPFHELNFKKLAIEPENGQILRPRSSGLLTLELAFGWLQLHYPQLHDSVAKIIAEDQEESLPLKWELLVVDWDNSYWVVWIFIVWVLWAKDGAAFLNRHPDLSVWVNEMKKASSSMPQEEVYGKLWAHETEKSTINHTITQLLLLTMFEDNNKLFHADSWESLRNFASYITQTETIIVSVRRNAEGQDIDEKMLAIAAPPH